MPKFLFSIALTLLCLNVHMDTAAQSSPRGTHLVEIGVADSLYSDILQEQRTFWIHLPNGGDLQPDHDYPVIYVLDGGEHLGGLAMVQQYYNYFRMPEMIVVGISNRTNRTRDLTTSHVETRHGMAVQESGGAEQFTRFLAEELIPYVDANFPTLDYRTLIGHSYAGLFTINTLVHHRDLFTNYIAIDPSLGWDNQALLKEAEKALSEEDFSGKGLYVSMANELLRFTETLTIETVMQDTTDFSLSVRSILEFVHLAEAKRSNGLQFDWAFYETDIHGSIPLVSMRDGLVFLFDWFELKSPSLYNDPSTSTETIVGLIEERATTLTRNMGFPMAMEEDLLTMLGYMALDMDQIDKARAVFELTATYYPESVAAHESLVDFFESQGDWAQALQHASHAFDLSGSPELKERMEGLKAKQ